MFRTAAVRTVVVGAALVLTCAASWAKGKPTPVSCPPDVALAVAAACPCNGTVEGGALVPWRNHGQYVRCVAHYRNALRKGGCLSAEEKRGVVRCAARSSCGKTGAPIVCCTVTLAPCSDPVPDGVAAGVCDDGSGRACDVADDCVVTATSLVDDPAGCTAGGGVVEGAGATCSICTAP